MSNRAPNGRRNGAPNRVSMCGSKGGGSVYDPQVGAAAQASAANAAQAQKFSQDYFTNTVSPLLAAETAQSKQTTANQNQLFGLNFANAQKQSDQYNTYGLPAQNSYYNMVKNYSSKDEQNTEANAAIGDMRTAEASQAGSIGRQRASLGIDPTSGMAQSNDAMTAVGNTAAEAAAATRARDNAKRLGMSLTSDAASFSNTGVSNMAVMGGQAGAATNSALGSSASALNGANSSAAVPMAGYTLANSAYGNNMDAYSRMASADIQAQASADSGLGQFLGAAGSIGLKMAGISDRRLKRNIKRVGTWHHDLPLYQFNYVWDKTKYVGVMADEVAKVMPDAVVIHASGAHMVDYKMLRDAA